MQYEREKNKKEDNLKQNKENLSKCKTCPSELNQEIPDTAQRLSEQHNVSPLTIKDDGAFAKVADKISENIRV